MLTQGPAPDPKCKLNISSFFTLPHLLDCLICTRCQVPHLLDCLIYAHCIAIINDAGWDRWEMIDLCQGVGGETGGGYYLIAVVFLTWAVVFCSLMSSVSFFKWLEHDSCCVCFFVYYLCSLSLVSLTKSYWCIEIVVSHIKLFIKLVSNHYSVDFLGKDRVF